MESIRGFLKILFKFNTVRYGLLEFQEHLSMAAVIRFGSTCFSEHLKAAAAFFIKKPYYFFLGIYLFKESYKETWSSHDEREFHHYFSVCFHHYFLRPHSSKTFIYWQNLNYMRVLILHGDWLNGSPRYYC